MTILEGKLIPQNVKSATVRIHLHTKTPLDFLVGPSDGETWQASHYFQ